MKKKILVYRDHGQWVEGPILVKKWIENNIINPNKFDVEFTNATEIIKLNVLNFGNVVGFFMPGGHSRAYAKKLNGLGNERIKKFVENGGNYVGICGGAYYACANIEFKGEDLDIKTESELNFFKGVAKGSIPEFTNNIYFNNTVFATNAVVLQTNQDDEVNIYYNGGSFFIPIKDEKFQVLAKYKELETPSVVRVPYGKGYAVLSGVHPEYKHDDLNEIYKCSTGEKKDYLRPILKKLKQSEDDGGVKKFAQLVLQDF